MKVIRYVKTTDAYLSRRAGDSPRKNSNRSLLLGARLHVHEDSISNGWAAANTVPNKEGEFDQGFINLEMLSEQQQLKVFYTDVGQGDATLIEAEGAIVIIDGGPNKGFYDILLNRLATLRKADEDMGLPPREVLFINAVVISHFDKDHYYGLVQFFKDKNFSVGALYHNGLPRYGDNAEKDLLLGTIQEHQDGTQSLSTDLEGFETARAMASDPILLKTKIGNNNYFAKFLLAVISAHDDGRLSSMSKLYRRKTDGTPSHINNIGQDLKIEVLAPVTTKPTGPIRLSLFPNPHVRSTKPKASESHTINGNSVVLRLKYKNNIFLFGGDLNQPAQKYLRSKYGGTLPFNAHVNKACHHGSSDFDLDYLKDVLPMATVFSSGDDGNYDHPLPDALGAAARYSQGEYPLVFSTELARETKVTGGKMLGHINARSNGTVVVMAQKKEKVSKKNPWHTFPLPYAGPFHGH